MEYSTKSPEYRIRGYHLNVPSKRNAYTTVEDLKSLPVLANVDKSWSFDNTHILWAMERKPMRI